MFIAQSLLEQHFLWGLLLLSLAALIAGYVDAVAGGAGLLLIPAMIMLGLPTQVALGQEKLVSMVGTLAAIRNFMRSRAIIWQVVPLGVVMALLGAYVGAKCVLILPVKVLTLVVICLLPIGLIITLCKSRLLARANDRENGQFTSSKLLLSMVCLSVGFYDGFFGPGTGSLFIIALFLINQFTLLNASATAKIFNFCSNFGALIAFLMAGKLMFLLSIPMILANIVGNHFGSQHTISSNGRLVQKVLVLSVVLLIISLSLHIL
ncbi:TSUP family transporter [Acinetobacter sp. MD2(2019)]|uniref:TSUP family transporter n=1 Tax=Acinetobacter sp. MD2(2019) TaxID=2605273 RepID=UPI002D1EEEFA|nr:TSUP family transporter [Acinetobacter sp. MD2(2019)]MEB3754452.1 TSUP family transporter [Acinetobacter sp. MD2(2019)]